jgi:hypothetical protein
VVVPDDFTLGDFHDLIRRVMGWSGWHLFDWCGERDREKFDLESVNRLLHR